MMTKMTLEQQLAEVVEQIEKMHKRHEATSGFATNPAGDFGGIRSRSQRTKDRMFDRWSKQADEAIKLYKKRDSIKAQIKYLEEKPAKEAKQLRYDLLVLTWWDQIKPGDTWAPGNNDLVITKKNAKSILAGGCKWSIGEVTGLRAQRIAELRKIQSESAG
jgi:hypothetical protein